MINFKLKYADINIKLINGFMKFAKKLIKTLTHIKKLLTTKK